MSDMLKQAKQSLAISFGDYSQEINAQRAQAAALIAIAERLDQQNEHLEYLRGSLNVIVSALTGISCTLSNAEGPDGAIKVTR